MSKKQMLFLTILLCVFIMLCSCNKTNLTTTNSSEETTQHEASNQSFHTTINDNSFSTVITKNKKSETYTKQSVVNNTENSTAFNKSTLVTESITTDKMKKYTNNHNGIVLSVYAPETVVFGEKFYVVAKITNNSYENITYALPSGTPNSHLEICVDINDGRKSFIDCDTFGKPFEDSTITKSLLPGEHFEERISFLPGWTEELGILELDIAKITLFDSGTYSGTAVFNWDTEEDVDSISLEFPIIVV